MGQKAAYRTLQMLLSRPTPIDEQASSRDELGCVRGEIDHCSRDIRDITYFARWNTAKHILAIDWVVEALGGARRVDKSGPNCVNSDAKLGPLQRHYASELVDAAFARAVDGVIDNAYYASMRALFVVVSVFSCVFVF